MSYFVGLDVSQKTTFVCIVDQKGKRIQEEEVDSTPEAIHTFLLKTNLPIEQIGLESGNLTHYLKKGLLTHNYPVVVMESRKMAAILKVIINKTDKNDARGIAEALRAGHFRECVHRSDEALQIRSLLHIRQTAIEERTHVTNRIRGHLKLYGIRFNKKAGKKFKDDVVKAVQVLHPQVQVAIGSLLIILDTLHEQIGLLDMQVELTARQDPDVQLLETIDGVGPITALAFKAEIDDPGRFKKSKNVGAYIGLTPRQYSSGEIERQGSISKKGSIRMRYLLVEAAMSILTRSKKWSKLKAWGLKLQKKKGLRKASVAVARKLAVIMHKMLLTGKSFDRGPTKKETVAA